MTIEELMELMKSDSGKFLQKDCIFQLRAFLRGFLLSKNSAIRAISEDQKVLERIDSIVRKTYNVIPSAHISVEEILEDYEGKNAFNKYLEIWFKNVN